MHPIETVFNLISEIKYKCVGNATSGRTQPRRIIVSESTENDVQKYKKISEYKKSDETLDLITAENVPCVYTDDFLEFLKNEAPTQKITIDGKEIISVDSSEFWDEICI